MARKLYSVPASWSCAFMSSKTYFKVLLASFLIGIGISVVGCGSSDSGSSANPPGNIASQVVVNGQTPNNCVTGFITAALDGTRVCQSVVFPDRLFYPQMVVQVPRLSPSNPASSLAPPVTPRTTVQPNDKLTIIDVSGKWGTVTESGGYFKKYKCEMNVNSAGKRNDGVEITNEGLPSGLYLTNGRSIYPAFGQSVLYFNEAGPLHYGFNLPASEQACSFSARLRFKLERCLDVASLPHKCK